MEILSCITHKKSPFLEVIGCSIAYVETNFSDELTTKPEGYHWIHKKLQRRTGH